MVGPVHDEDVAELRNGPEGHGEVQLANQWLKLVIWTKPNLLKPKKSYFFAFFTQI